MIIVVLFLGAVLILQYRSRHKLLPQIKEKDVRSIMFNGEKQQDFNEILGYYNQIDHVYEGSGGMNTTPYGNITIELKSGVTIEICDDLGENLYIVVTDKDKKWKDYWGKQPELYDMLHDYILETS